MSLVVALAGLASAVDEIRTYRYPLVLPGAPLGSYARPTVLGLLGLVTSLLLVVAGSLLAFRRPGLGGPLFVASGLLNLVGAARMRLFDATFPPGNLAAALAGVVLPALAVGGVLLLASWAERSGCGQALPADREPGAAAGSASTGAAIPR